MVEVVADDGVFHRAVGIVVVVVAMLDPPSVVANALLVEGDAVIFVVLIGQFTIARYIVEALIALAIQIIERAVGGSPIRRRKLRLEDNAGGVFFFVGVGRVGVFEGVADANPVGIVRII